MACRDVVGLFWPNNYEFGGSLAACCFQHFSELCFYVVPVFGVWQLGQIEFNSSGSVEPKFSR